MTTRNLALIAVMVALPATLVTKVAHGSNNGLYLKNSSNVYNKSRIPKGFFPPGYGDNNGYEYGNFNGNYTGPGLGGYGMGGYGAPGYDGFGYGFDGYAFGLSNLWGRGGYGDPNYPTFNMRACDEFTADKSNCTAQDPDTAGEEWRFVTHIGWKRFTRYGAAQNDWMNFKRTMDPPFIGNNFIRQQFRSFR